MHAGPTGAFSPCRLLGRARRTCARSPVVHGRHASPAMRADVCRRGQQAKPHPQPATATATAAAAAAAGVTRTTNDNCC